MMNALNPFLVLPIQLPITFSIESIHQNLRHPLKCLEGGQEQLLKVAAWKWAFMALSLRTITENYNSIHITEELGGSRICH